MELLQIAYDHRSQGDCFTVKRWSIRRTEGNTCRTSVSRTRKSCTTA